MRSSKWIYACAALLLAFTSISVLAKEHGRGHDRDEEKREHYYSDRDREDMHIWYRDHAGHLPPGLAKRDQLPPGLERQLRVRGTLPPGLQKKIQPCPPELEQRLPPPPPDCAHVVIGGHLVLVNRRTWVVLDIFHFEL